jgi:type II secretory pathway component PulF
VDSTQKSPFSVVTLLLVGLFLLLCLGLVGQVFFVVPAYEKTFEDFRMRLPVVTEMAILVARIAVNYWVLSVPVIFAAIALACWLSYLVRHRSNIRWLCVLWFVLLIGVPAVANATLWTALWLPYKRLEEGLRK